MTKLFEHARRTKRTRRTLTTTALAMLALATMLALMLAGSSGAASTAVPLGAAGSFAILAGGGITNTGPATVSGDIGTYATTSYTGSASVTQNGTNHAGDSVTQNAKNDLVAAYNNAAGQGPQNPIVGLTLGGKVLTRGVYNSASTIDLTGTVTLDGQGDPNSVFVIQAGSALTTATSSTVALINGANACNVFWQIGSDATLGVGSTFVGNLLVQNAIVLDTNATVSGRVLASVASVTLDTNTIAIPSCPAAGSGSSPSRTLYCQGGTAYNLIVGQDKVAPYAALNLTPGFIDPATGQLTCSLTTTTTTSATTTTATTPTATTPTPKPTGPTAKQIAAAKARRLAAVKAQQIALAKARRLAAAKSAAIAKAKPKPKAAITTTFGFTG